MFTVYAPMRLFRVAAFNPMFPSTVALCIQIPLQFPNYAIVGLPGIQVRGEQPHFQQAGPHTYVHFPWKPGRYTNTLTAPPELEGRVGALVLC